MSERRVSRRGPVATFRVVGGTIAVLTPLALGALGHSPWKALLLVPAFAASYAISRGADRRRVRPDGARSTISIVSAALSIAFVHLLLVGALYLVGLGLGALLFDALPLDSLSFADLLLVALVSAVTLVCAALARRLGGRRTLPPSGP